MMDEQLIDEVAQHGVIFNRQKYYLNGSNGPGSGGGKYETKDEAWQTIAIKLRTDVETCKKRWKYLRERYVSQRKQGDPPVYEHLSRPYLEKMKFLDQHIQPRKSYRNVPNFLTSPHSVNSSNYSEFNMDSKSNGSIKNIGHFGNSQHHYHQPDHQHPMNALSSSAAATSATESGNGQVKIEADQMFRDFAAAVASQQLQQISQTQLHHHQAAAVAAAIADSSQNYNENYRDGNNISGNSVTQNGNSSGMGISSSSSSMKSPLSSPLAGVNGNHNGTNHHHSTSSAQQAIASSSSNQLTTHPYGDSNTDELDSSTGSNYHAKKPRVQLNSNVGNMSHNNNHSQHQHAGSHNTSNATNTHFIDDTDDESDDNSNGLLQPQAILNDNHNNHYDNTASTSSAAAIQRNPSSSNSGQQQQQQGMFPANADFLFQLYQQLPHQQQQNINTPQQQQHFNKFQAPQNPAPARCSEHLLGELVTTELLKMSKERRKHVQKRILEILFFDD
ncbi:uncharacterized membrane protein DDB_G0293934 [Anastrepha obliqua]|uniref:uncharacterized membrane protein DDB_G0293934 n=1 Tax=Anastrepha obliqua TaxID=95512 RepID=UPI00240A391F|nr:uncharacterized membrane protein DDB_G0293934 [Anastrepha obliqua]